MAYHRMESATHTPHPIRHADPWAPVLALTMAAGACWLAWTLWSRDLGVLEAARVYVAMFVASTMAMVAGVWGLHAAPGSRLRRLRQAVSVVALAVGVAGVFASVLVIVLGTAFADYAA